MTRGRWHAGWKHKVAGIHLRVVTGKKSPDDLRIEWLTSEGWIAIPMAAGAVMADFWYENEDVLYPPPAMGGRKYLSYLATAARDGWEAADATLQAERAAKRGEPPSPRILPPTESPSTPVQADVCPKCRKPPLASQPEAFDSRILLHTCERGHNWWAAA